MIGIILQETIPFGSPKRQSTTLAQRVGVFPMAAAMESGQGLRVLHHLIMTLMTAIKRV